MIDILKLQKFVSDKDVEKRLLVEQLNQKSIQMESSKKTHSNMIKARWVISEASRLSQFKISEHIESLVTMVLLAVYERPFKFLVDFNIKRNKSECSLLLYEGLELKREEMIEKSFVPKDEEGGGILDVISFALRVVFWSIRNPKNRNIFILDEPFRFLGDLIEKAGDMVKEISSKLDIQLIITTHDNRLKEIGDRSWQVIRNGEYSIVKQEGIFEERRMLKKLKK
jgi:hypothetical protein